MGPFPSPSPFFINYIFNNYWSNDGVKQRHIVQQVTSTLTGPIVVEDVIYENGDGDGNGPIASKHSVFRRLTFQRSLGLVQSEALITRGHSQKIPAEAERKKVSSSKSRKKGSLRKNDCRMSLIDESRSNLKVDHNYLASSYHIGIISGFTLIASNLESAISSGKMVKAVIIGLGAGLLPMFLRACMPFLEIEVVELDPVISDLARDHFGFTEDKQLKVLIADGVEFVRKVAIGASSKVNADLENFDALSKERPTVPNGSPTKSPACGKSSRKIDILVVDADSSDSSSGITCPPADFVEESFLLSVKESLSEGGLFVINLVSRSPTIREMVVSRMKVVFGHLFSLQLEEDVNEVLFALPRETCIEENSLLKAAPQLEKLLKFTQTETGQNILDTARKITSLK
uniref:Methyltransferase-like protein 13 n=1 Tax=Nelumbo nucifera TaxID=4432 RepID=A0A822XVI6_NELNU|nr:TPA_asm: hypothetical protein HUJ06_025455 [Nelumbo nucifera]